MECYLVLPRHMTASIYASIWLRAYMELQRYVSLMFLFGAPSDPLFGALSDPLFGAPSEPPTNQEWMMDKYGQSLDWLKGTFTGTPHIWWEDPGFPVHVPLNQSNKTTMGSNSDHLCHSCAPRPPWGEKSKRPCWSPAFSKASVGSMKIPESCRAEQCGRVLLRQSYPTQLPIACHRLSSSSYIFMQIPAP